MLTAKRAGDRLHYNQDAGVLVWKFRDRVEFKTDKHWKIWNTRYAGTEAGWVYSDSHGNKYLCVTVDGRKYRAHRVIWLMTTGAWPVNHIDHIDGDGMNNAISNLRDVTASQNHRNQKIDSRSKTGIPGVRFCSDTQKYETRIHNRGKSQRLGRFTDFFEACCARKAAELALEFHPNHGRKAA